LATSPVYHSFLQDVENLNEELQAGKRKDGNLESLKEVLLVSRDQIYICISNIL